MGRVLKQKGQSLIEILFAVAVFTIGTVTIGYLVFDSFDSLSYSIASMQARLLAIEGIEAVYSLRDGGFENIESGTFGLELQSGHWTLSVPPEIEGRFSRTIRIDAIDDVLKEVTSSVIWSVTGGHEKEVSFTTRISNWKQTGGQAEYLGVDIRDASLSASGTELDNISLQNIGDDNIVIVGMTIAWSAPAFLEHIAIEGTDVFLASTTSPAGSDEYIDIADYEVDVFSGSHVIDSLTFDEAVADSDFVLTFILEDESRRYVYVSL